MEHLWVGVLSRGGIPHDRENSYPFPVLSVGEGAHIPVVGKPLCLQTYAGNVYVGILES